jgi:hypothetical protein
VRRGILARALDQIERHLEHAPLPLTDRLAERPPWALWHDPGAQAAYVAAESMADAIEDVVGLAPAPGALAEALVAQREQIDRVDTTIL